MKPYKYWSPRAKLVMLILFAMLVILLNAFEVWLRGFEQGMKNLLVTNAIMVAAFAWYVHDLRRHKARLRCEPVKQSWSVTPNERMLLDILGICAAVSLWIAWSVYLYQHEDPGWLFDSFTRAIPLGGVAVGMMARDIYEIRKARDYPASYLGEA